MVWSQRFEGLREDIFELQDQITAQVVASIEPKLMLAELELTRSKPTEKLQAYELCLRALVACSVHATVARPLAGFPAGQGGVRSTIYFSS